MAEQATLEGFNAAALRVGVTGALRSAPLGTEPRTDFTTKYDTDVYHNWGYLSPDGISIEFDEDTNEYIPWQEMVAVRRDITKSVKNIQVTLWQFTRDNAARFFGVPGGDVTVNEDGTWGFDEEGVPEFMHEQVILDIVDGNRAAKLTLFDAQITARSGLTIKRDDAIGLQITLSSFPAGSEYAAELQGKTTRWLFSENWDGSGATGGGTTPPVTP